MIVYVWWVILVVYSVFALWMAYGNPYDIYSRIYVTACAVRSIWPRQDGNRICLFPTWISYPFVGRSLATIAEICIAYQLSLLLKNNLILYLGIIAQFFCWGGVITRCNKWHVVEESLWFIIGMMCTLSTNGWIVTGAVLYCLFMIFIDIPMYYNRYIVDEQSNKQYHGWNDIWDTMRCQKNDSYQTWKPEILWMSGYFILCTQFSLYMSLKKYKIN